MKKSPSSRRASLALFGAALLTMSGATPAQGVSVSGQAGNQGYRAHSLRIAPIFVDLNATGNGTGSNWQDAFADLQDALAVAQRGDQIWVAGGAYAPAPAGGDTSISFGVPSGVALFGGFAGTETTLAQRDPVANRTTLTGDLNGDDTYSPFKIFTPNSLNIVTMVNANAATQLDGFEIIAGHAIAGGMALNGAGVLLTNSSPVIANCEFSFNVSVDGGALSSSLGNPVIQNCSFSNNFASSYNAHGGAINNNGGVLLVMDSSFSVNEAEALGGAAYGGAIYSEIGSSFIDRCSFSFNQSLPRQGGGLSVSFGGAVFAETGLVRITDSIFTNNLSNIGGAVVSNPYFASTLELHNSQVIGNSAIPTILSGGVEGGGDAGGIYGGSISTLDVIGCLVYGNTGDNEGGAFVGNGRVANSIFWNNSDQKGDIGVSQINADLVEYSCVMNMLVGEPGEDPPDPSKFPGSIALNPQFADEPLGDYHLLPNSPCIDAADNSAWPAFVSTDYEGNPRFVDDPSVIDTGVGPAPISDMGPYEKN